MGKTGLAKPINSQECMELNGVECRGTIPELDGTKELGHVSKNDKRADSFYKSRIAITSPMESFLFYKRVLLERI